MPYEKYSKPIAKLGRPPAQPRLTILKKGSFVANAALASAIGLDTYGHYDLYIDRARKLVGIDVLKNGAYRAGRAGKALSLAAVRQALVDLGCDITGPKHIEIEIGKHLPVPILLQFSYAPLLSKKERSED